MSRLTSQTLLQSSRLHRLDDVIYTPLPHPIEVIVQSIKTLLAKISPDDIFVTFPFLFFITLAYRNRSNFKNELPQVTLVFLFQIQLEHTKQKAEITPLIFTYRI